MSLSPAATQAWEKIKRYGKSEFGVMHVFPVGEVGPALDELDAAGYISYAADDNIIGGTITVLKAE